VWWFVILTRGCVKFEVMPADWTQNGEGMAVLVGRLEGLLCKMLGKTCAKPRVVFSDRGPGFYDSGHGMIVHKYRDALKESGFRPFAGEDASHQPADCPDMFLHETVVAWVRRYFKSWPFTLTENAEKNYDSFLEAMKSCAHHINSNYDVEGLSKGFASRLQQLVDAKGQRLKY
jgi:hypothetical protein